MSVPVRHPAKFSDTILSEIGLLIDEYSIKGLAVDPFAGVGKVYVLESPSLKVVGVEIESEWASQHESTVCGDSLELAELFDGQAVSAIITSPTYSNRMCLVAGTMVTTWEGPTPIQDVQPGTLVLTHDGQWRPVVWAGSRGVKPVVVVRGQGGGSITCTPDHPFWSAARGDGGIREIGWRDAKDLAPREDMSPPYKFRYWSHPVDIAPPSLPPCPRGADIWWFIGFYLGNGSVGNNSTTGKPSTVFVTKDLVHLPIVEGRFAAIDVRRLPDVGKMGRWALYDSDMACWLRATFGHSAYTKTVPGWVLGLDSDERSALLDGWLDADGCRNKKQTSRIGISVSERLIRGMQMVAVSVGRSTSYSTRDGYKGEIMGHPSTFVDSFRLDVHDGISRRAHLSNGSLWYAVREVNPAGETEVFDLEVAESHSFIANGIAVHNSDQYKGDPKGSVRHTYRIYLGRDLSENNSGRMQWGAKYREFHEKAWAECVKVLREGMKTYGEDGGWMILNISDHIRKGKVMPVVQWHVDTLIELGFEIVEQRKVLTPRQRHGANGEKRVSGERVIVAKLVA
jgi:hypothetical protein